MPTASEGLGVGSSIANLQNRRTKKAPLDVSHTLGLPQVGCVIPLAISSIRIRTFYLLLHTSTINWLGKQNRCLSRHSHRSKGDKAHSVVEQRKLPLSQWRSLVSPHSERTTSHWFGWLITQGIIGDQKGGFTVQTSTNQSQLLQNPNTTTWI
jgi:hypothetical protein